MRDGAIYGRKNMDMCGLGVSIVKLWHGYTNKTINTETKSLYSECMGEVVGQGNRHPLYIEMHTCPFYEIISTLLYSNGCLAGRNDNEKIDRNLVSNYSRNMITKILEDHDNKGAKTSTLKNPFIFDEMAKKEYFFPNEDKELIKYFKGLKKSKEVYQGELEKSRKGS